MRNGYEQFGAQPLSWTTRWAWHSDASVLEVEILLSPRPDLEQGLEPAGSIGGDASFGNASGFGRAFRDGARCGGKTRAAQEQDEQKIFCEFIPSGAVKGRVNANRKKGCAYAGGAARDLSGPLRRGGSESNLSGEKQRAKMLD